MALVSPTLVPPAAPTDRIPAAAAGQASAGQASAGVMQHSPADVTDRASAPVLDRAIVPTTNGASARAVARASLRTADVVDDRAHAAAGVLPAPLHDRDAARRAARRRLPAPATIAGSIAIALLEVEAGRRSATQLERVCAPGLWDILASRIKRRGGPVPGGRALLRVHCQEHVPGLADAVAVVRCGTRVRPVALRLDAGSGRWTMTELAY